MNTRFQEILSLAQSGQTQRALSKCEQAIKKKPRDSNLLLLAASLHAQNKDYRKIVDCCKRAATLDPKNFSALFNLSIAYAELGDYENVQRSCRKALLLDKKNAKVLSTLGLAQWKLGQLDEAKTSCLSAIQLEPHLATAQNNLGLVYKSLNDIESAIKYFKQANQSDPRLAEAYYNCGITMMDAGEESGISYIDKALLINPGYPEANNYKGLMLLESNQASASVEYFNKAIQNKPDFAEAYCNLGNALMEAQDFKAAENMYKKAIKYNPGFANAYNNLANALLDQDGFCQRGEEAEAYYLKAMEIEPELDDTYKNLAIYYQGEGIHEKALHYFRLYDERKPNDKIVIAGIASIHERRGEHDEGMALIKPFIESDDNDANSPGAEIIIAYAKLAKHFKQEDHAIELLNSINDDSIINKLRIDKYYALGKLTEPKGDADKTLLYYKQANDLDDEIFDLKTEQKIFNNITSYYSKEKLQSLNRSDNTSTLPIFIVGMPRSGTSLAEQVLASHPDVYGAGELKNMHNIVDKIGNELKPIHYYPSNLDNMSSEYASKLASEHIEALQALAPADTKFVVDKMPHNFMLLGLLNLLFPKATVIHCKRSSVDTCLSIYFQHFNKHHAYSTSLEMLGKYYNIYADMMEHWKNTLDMNFIELEYENMIANPQDEIRSLLERCGIEWDPICLKFHETKRTVMTPSYDQVRRPIYTSSVAKWKKYEHHLGDLISSLGARAY